MMIETNDIFDFIRLSMLIVSLTGFGPLEETMIKLRTNKSAQVLLV